MAALYDSVTESPHVSHRFLLTLLSVQFEHNGQCIGNYRCTSGALLGIFWAFENSIMGQKISMICLPLVMTSPNKPTNERFDGINFVEASGNWLIPKLIGKINISLVPPANPIVWSNKDSCCNFLIDISIIVYQLCNYRAQCMQVVLSQPTWLTCRLHCITLYRPRYTSASHLAIGRVKSSAMKWTPSSDVCICG